MTKYIKISNYAPCVNRLSLEKLGYSSKRNDPDTIGQFGSGIKYAPIAALRLGLDFVFTGTDDKGSYILKYKSQVQDGINCIVYDYGDYTENSSFTLEAGIMSWDNEFQIYREAISNAKDGGFEKRSIVNKITVEKDTFSVFITASPAMMEIYNNHDLYFCENTNKLFSHLGSSILEKKSKDFRVFCKTVLVHKDSQVNSMFDYEINSAGLNEDRNLRSLYSNEYDIIDLYSKLKDQELQTKIIKKALSDSTIFEFKNISDSKWSIYSYDKSWANSFYSIFGSNAVIVSPMLQTIENISYRIKEYGCEPVNINSIGLYTLLEKSGIETALSKLGEKAQYDTEDDISQYSKLVEAIKISEHFEPGLKKMKLPIVVFSSLSSELKVLGQVVNLKEENAQIMIEKNHAINSDVPNLISTIIHEYDHYSSKITDSEYREFRDLADKRIGNLFYHMYKESIGVLHNGTIKFKSIDIMKLKTLNYVIEYSKVLGAHIAKFGELVYLLNIGDEIIQKNGVLSVSDNGEEFYVNINKQGTMERLRN
jgi:hypothetical protein